MSTRQILILTQCIFKHLLLHVYWKFTPESFLIFLLLLNELEKSIYSNYSICRWHLEKISNSVSLQCRVWYYVLPYIISRFGGWILTFHCAVARLNLHKHLPELGTWIKHHSPLQHDSQVGKAKALTPPCTLELLNGEGVKGGFCSFSQHINPFA